MRITLKFSGNVYKLMRECGYYPHEDGFVRRLSNSDYPRLHAYVSRETSGQEIEISLHLDQKKPIYKGARAHSGEYDGELVEKEAERIKKIAGP